MRFRLMFSVAVALSTMVLEAASASNGYIDVYTSCIDVLVIKGIDNDFHLLVTNKNASARVSVIAHNPPYRLVKPGSGDGVVSIGHPMRYEVAKAQNGNAEKDGEPSTGGWIIMFCPDFIVESDVIRQAPSKKSLFGDLTDNFAATVHARCDGIPSLRGHCPKVLVQHVNCSPKLVNNVGTFSIDVKADENILDWPTSKTFWYGELMPSNDFDWDQWGKCCCQYCSPYEFILIVDGIDCVRKEYTVGRPNEKPEMIITSPKRDDNRQWPQICSISSVSVKNNICYVLLSIGEYQKSVQFRDLPSVSQYSGEIQAEEEFHRQQFFGNCSFELGGCADLFTRRGFVYYLRNKLSEQSLSLTKVSDNMYSVQSENFNILSLLNMAIAAAATQEGNASALLWRNRELYREFKAKERAGYNAYGKYHCTYYKRSHIKKPQMGAKHEAFR